MRSSSRASGTARRIGRAKSGDTRPRYPTPHRRFAPKNRAPQKIYPTGLRPIVSSTHPHTGDFEELRNFGMCGPRLARRDCSRKTELSRRTRGMREGPTKVRRSQRECEEGEQFPNLNGVRIGACAARVTGRRRSELSGLVWKAPGCAVNSVKRRSGPNNREAGRAKRAR